ncbi:hypothetical protein [Pseudomonas uvaldensis]|uniref:hypothetical protein n=1 Tax=Pseudomonas uvaldensis TaxID=2878385 RepID=UPI001E4E512A|nr:hypothetical protein [Pseudomonas uvaldensis]MCE0464889.1 hypothetical protein [Pseudomonas uvaldensis]
MAFSHLHSFQTTAAGEAMSDGEGVGFEIRGLDASNITMGNMVFNGMKVGMKVTNCINVEADNVVGIDTETLAFVRGTDGFKARNFRELERPFQPQIKALAISVREAIYGYV